MKTYNEIGNKIISRSLRDAHQKAIKLILSKGIDSFDENVMIKELLNLTICLIDPTIENDYYRTEFPEMNDWMQKNFNCADKVSELGNATSYYSRLRNYNGLDQIQWLTEKLKRKMETKSATITTLMPNSDSSYIPCISLIDFKIRERKLFVNVIARSIDVQNKMPFNIIEIFKIIDAIKQALGLTLKTIFTITVFSAHIYKG